ncbi:uncharacterized protein [Parasteatoda tepidariorum]|uniref:uncharacterized protein n=1 Tax=Parasteatoda tepidariorum TaxID=114398 RepID=UPI00077F9E00|nr:uncharacterized protein LOC107436140 [Parasteatoda tepidariorum]
MVTIYEESCFILRVVMYVIQIFKACIGIFTVFCFLWHAVSGVGGSCTASSDCKKNQVCVKGEYTECKKFANEGMLCTSHQRDIDFYDVWLQYPPCDPKKDLECRRRSGRYVCDKK